MSPDMIQALEALGCTVVRNRYVVVEDDHGVFGNLDEDGNPRLNRDKEGKIRDTFCVLPRNKAVKVYHGNSRVEVEQKMAAKTPDIVKEKDNVEISVGRTGR
jgi:hypothetical protein